MARLTPLALAISPARGHASPGAGDHHLARRIVIGDDADAACAAASLATASAFRYRRRSERSCAPSPTGTADCMAWPRVLSSRAVSAKAEGAGGSQRGIFAQRMAGHQAGMLGEIQPVFLLQDADDGERQRP